MREMILATVYGNLLKQSKKIVRVMTYPHVVYPIVYLISQSTARAIVHL